MSKKMEQIDQSELLPKKINEIILSHFQAVTIILQK